MRPSVWNDAVGVTGALAAASRGEAVSGFFVTDDEAEMRDRAWRFLVPTRGRPWLDRAIAELVATRVIPVDLVEPDRRAYHAGLIAEAGRSPVSLYRKLSQDAGGDLRLVGPLASVAARVLSADRLRLAALARAQEVGPAAAAAAEARVAENRCLVAWVTAASAFRLGAYRYALDLLFIEAPGPDAVPTEELLGRLAQERGRLVELGVPPLAAAACAGEEAPLARRQEILVRKG